MNDKDSGPVCATGYRTVFAHADEVWRRVVINGESSLKVGMSLRLPKLHVQALAKLLRHWQKVPTKSRLAAAAMLVPDATNEDIAWAFGMPVSWAAQVRKHRNGIRKYWTAPEGMEAAVEMEEGDPTPAQIAERCAAIPRVAHGSPHANYRPGIRSFRFDHNATLVPQLAD